MSVVDRHIERKLVANLEELNVTMKDIKRYLWNIQLIYSRLNHIQEEKYEEED